MHIDGTPRPLGPRPVATVLHFQPAGRASRSQHIHIRTLDIRYGTTHVYQYPRITVKKLTTPMLNSTFLYRNAYLRPQLFRTTPLDAIFLLPVWRKSSPNLHSLSLWEKTQSCICPTKLSPADLTINRRISGHKLSN